MTSLKDFSRQLSFFYSQISALLCKYWKLKLVAMIKAQVRTQLPFTFAKLIVFAPYCLFDAALNIFRRWHRSISYAWRKRRELSKGLRMVVNERSKESIYLQVFWKIACTACWLFSEIQILNCGVCHGRGRIGWAIQQLINLIWT